MPGDSTSNPNTTRELYTPNSLFPQRKTERTALKNLPIIGPRPIDNFPIRLFPL